MSNLNNQFKLYNRTKRYLLPILNTYPKIFRYELSKIPCEVYVGDVDYYRTRPFEKLIFLKIPTPKSKPFIQSCKDIRWFKDEYPLNLNDEYCVVLTIPEEFESSYQMFLEGKYSKMYSSQQIKQLGISQIVNGKINLTYCILTKNKMAYEEYKKVIKTVYETNHYPLEPDEYDIPPRIRMEFLNSIGNEDFVKQICPLRNL